MAVQKVKVARLVVNGVEISHVNFVSEIINRGVGKCPRFCFWLEAEWNYFNFPVVWKRRRND